MEKRSSSESSRQSKENLAKARLAKQMISRTRAALVATPILGLFLLFQNCAPAAQINSRELSSDGASQADVPMSKVIVHLQHDSNVTLSDVELVADDVVRVIDRDPTFVEDGAKPSESGATKSSVILEATQSVDSPSSYNLELPLGAEKIIVARGKVRDPISNVVSTYYGNAVVTLNDSVGDVTIQMVAVPH